MLWGEKLLQGDFLQSDNTLFRTYMQSDGNLVTYRMTPRGVVWHNNGHIAARGRPPPFDLEVQVRTWNLSYYRNIVANWRWLFKMKFQFLPKVHPAPSPPLFPTAWEGGIPPYAHEYRWSKFCNLGQFFCNKINLIQYDNNLVIYDGRHQYTWHTRTDGRGVKPAVLQLRDDGRLVLVDKNGTPLWRSHWFV